MAGLASLVDVSVSRNIKSVFGELNIPIFGEGNSGFIHSLSLSLSGRYDHYSDFGGTFNPKFGLTFEPVDWIKMRGTWGKAFQAPGLSDIAQIGVPQLSVLNTQLRPFFDPANRPSTGAPNSTYILTIGGVLPGLQPQKATTWSLGLDLKPPFIPGLELGMTYYNIDFQGLISVGPVNQPYFYTIFSNKVVTYNGGGGAGTPAQLQSLMDYWNLLASPANGVTPAAKASAEAQFGGNFGSVYAVMDGRTTNLGVVKTSGIDFYARYNQPTGFGSVYVDLAATKILTYANGGTTGLLDTWGFDINNTFKMSTTVGALIGNLRAQVTWAHTDGFRMTPSAQNLNQAFSDGMDVFNLFVQYKVPGENAIAKNLVLSLNVDNVFDTDPALYRGLSNSLYGANGFTLGRVVKFGVGKKF
jgi:iron complex outermembrane receptor protein